MKNYVLFRLLQMLIVLIGVSLIVFFLFAMLPGNFLDSDPYLTIQHRQELEILYGFDKPVMERYFSWIAGVLHGNFGYSLVYRQPVLELLNQYIWNSFFLSLMAFLLTWSIALVVGVYSAIKQYSLFDRGVTVLVFAAMSLPSFFIGLLLIKVFAVDLGVLPVGSMIDSGSTATGWAYLTQVFEHMVLPVTVLTLISVGSLTRYFRTGMLDVIHQDFVRTARAKGLKERTVIFKHALKNAILPAITLLGLKLPGLFSGAIITEQIFNWPGVGKIQMEALSTRDYPVLMAFTMLLSVLTIIGNFMADIASAAVDPRIRLK
jgi:peptide/nickel transport system permease protein